MEFTDNAQKDETIAEHLLHLMKTKDDMRERSLYSANGHTFEIRPVTFVECYKFEHEVPYSIIPRKGNEITSEEEIEDEDKITLLIQLLTPSRPITPVKQFKFFKWTIRDNYKVDFYNSCKGFTLIKWLEQKITNFDTGKKIRFYDLETKYGLTKLEIYDMIDKMYDLSNFPVHLRLKKIKGMPIHL